MSFCQWTKEETETFSKIQMEICDLKVGGYSNIEIAKRFDITPQAIYNSIRTTLTGNRWTPHESRGGGQKYLGDVEISTFFKKIEECYLNLNCLKTVEAVQLAYELRANRYFRCLQILDCLKNVFKSSRAKQIVNSLEPFIPCESWINHFCARHNITLKNPESLEEARRRCCNTAVIKQFFKQNKSILSKVHKCNLWNADESSSSLTKKFKVLITGKAEHSISSVSSVEPHITGMFCFNALGVRLDPFIILPKLAKLPEELRDIPAFFNSQSSGWMTKNIFLAFCVFFVSKVSKYKLDLPTEEAEQPTILILDNHSSRYNSLALEYLALHNVQLLTFPPHCSHLLQPFDVAAARSLKSNMEKYQYKKTINDVLLKLNSNASKARYKTIVSIVESWRTIDTEILKNGFRISGLAPFDENVIMSS